MSAGPGLKARATQQIFGTWASSVGEFLLARLPFEYGSNHTIATGRNRPGSPGKGLPNESGPYAQLIADGFDYTCLGHARMKGSSATESSSDLGFLLGENRPTILKIKCDPLLYNRKKLFVEHL